MHWEEYGMNNEALTRFTAAFIDELSKHEIDLVISPGSRSTPMAILAVEHPKLKTWLQIDERSAAFFALGIAKANRKPVALLCTSGTAAANYLPAITEAKQARVPLLILTADRPHELRDVGAPQAIDQIHLYGRYAKWFVEMPLPESSLQMLQYVRTTAGRAVTMASMGPAGPVHLNFPFREPLVPNLNVEGLWAGGRSEQPFVRSLEGKRKLEDIWAQHLVDEFTAIEKGVIVVGPHDEPDLSEAVVKLAEKLNYPILADPLSQLRSGNHTKDMIIDGYDSFLRSDEVKGKLKPELIIRIGAMPISKAFLLYLKRHRDVRQIIVDEDTEWREPTTSATDMVFANPSNFCHQLVSKLSDKQNSEWLNHWQDINTANQESLLRDGYIEEEFFEGQVILELIEHLPNEASIFVGNSMPIRDLDTFFMNNQKQIRTYANRGANGIDGVVSSAIGVAAYEDPLVLVIGDLSFYHDLNGLLATKLHQLNITIVLINNDGGGIFSFLPQAKEASHFEELFGTPIGLDYSHAVKMYNGEFTRPTSWNEFRSALHKGVGQEGLHVIELQTNRERNAELHKALWGKAIEGLRS